MTSTYFLKTVRGQNAAGLQSKSALTAKELDEHYRFKIGQILAESFSNCSMYIGSIDGFSEQKVDFLIQEQLWGEKIDDTYLRLKYSTPNQRAAMLPDDNSPWRGVNVERGNKLFVSICKTTTSERYKLILSDQELFPVIRSVISYNARLDFNPNVLSEAPQMLTVQDKSILSGYIVSLLRSRWMNNEENAALVLIQLLENFDLPQTAWGYARITLRQILLHKGEHTFAPTLSDSIVKRIINVGGSESKAAESAISLLIELTKQGKDIKQYLNEENRSKLLQNYKTLVSKNISAKDRLKFEKLLLND
jgi:hypothetical protein